MPRKRRSSSPSEDAPVVSEGPPPEPAADEPLGDEPESVPSERELTIDELAAETKLPSRTIRFYQSKGVLPGPRIRGRVAYYGVEHIARLELVSELKDRGLTIKAIRDLMARVDKGELDLGDWLGLEARLTDRWADDAPRVVTDAELTELVGERRPGFLTELEAAGLVKRERGALLVRSPALLDMALKLHRSDVDLDVAVKAAEIMRRHLARAADELATWFLDRAGRGFGKTASPEEIGAAYEALRPTGLDAVRLIFGQEIERAIGEAVRSGRATRVSGRK